MMAGMDKAADGFKPLLPQSRRVNKHAKESIQSCQFVNGSVRYPYQEDMN